MKKWDKLLAQLRLNEAFDERVNKNFGSPEMAKYALEKMIDDSFWEKLVEIQYKGEPGGELARHILKLIKPDAAWKRCFEIYTNCHNEEKYAWISLWSDIANGNALKILPTLLEEKDSLIIERIAMFVENMANSGKLLGEPLSKVLKKLEQIGNENVKDIRHIVYKDHLAE